MEHWVSSDYDPSPLPEDSIHFWDGDIDSLLLETFDDGCGGVTAGMANNEVSTQLAARNVTSGMILAAARKVSVATESTAAFYHGDGPMVGANNDRRERKRQGTKRIGLKQKRHDHEQDRSCGGEHEGKSFACKRVRRRSCNANNGATGSIQKSNGSPPSKSVAHTKNAGTECCSKTQAFSDESSLYTCLGNDSGEDSTVSAFSVAKVTSDLDDCTIGVPFLVQFNIHPVLASSITSAAGDLYPDNCVCKRFDNNDTGRGKLETMLQQCAKLVENLEEDVVRAKSTGGMNVEMDPPNGKVKGASKQHWKHAENDADYVQSAYLSAAKTSTPPSLAVDTRLPRYVTGGPHSRPYVGGYAAAAYEAARAFHYSMLEHNSS